MTTTNSRTKRLARRLAELGNATYQQALGHIAEHDTTFGADETNRWVANRELVAVLRAEEPAFTANDGAGDGYYLHGPIGRHGGCVWTLWVDTDNLRWSIKAANPDTLDEATIWTSAFHTPTGDTYAFADYHRDQTVRDRVAVTLAALLVSTRTHLARPAETLGTDTIAGTVAVNPHTFADDTIPPVLYRAVADIVVAQFREDANGWTGPIPTADNLHDLCDGNMAVHGGIEAVFGPTDVDGNDQVFADRFNAAYDAVMNHPQVDDTADEYRITAMYRAMWGRQPDWAPVARPFADETFSGVTVAADGIASGTATRNGSDIRFSANPVMAIIREAFYLSNEATHGLWSLQDGMAGLSGSEAGWDWSALRDSSGPAIAAMFDLARQYVTPTDLAGAWGVAPDIIDTAIRTRLAGHDRDRTTPGAPFLLDLSTGRATPIDTPTLDVPDTPAAVGHDVLDLIADTARGAADGTDATVTVGTIDAGSTGVAVELDGWTLNWWKADPGVWGWSWFNDDGDDLSFGNLADRSGATFTADFVAGSDALLVADAVQWVTAAFVADPSTGKPDGTAPAGVHDEG